VAEGAFIAFHDPSWTKATCERYVLFPEALKVVTSFVIGGEYWIHVHYAMMLKQSPVIFILRLYGIYSQSYSIAAFAAVLLVAELAVKIVGCLKHDLHLTLTLS